MLLFQSCSMHSAAQSGADQPGAVLQHDQNHANPYQAASIDARGAELDACTSFSALNCIVDSYLPHVGDSLHTGPGRPWHKVEIL